MNIAPLLAAPVVVWIHLATILPAFAIGTWLLFVSEKGSRSHRTAGKLYMSLMATTAVAACFIRTPSGLPAIDLGPVRFGPIHLFIPLTAWGIYRALSGVRRGNIAQHRAAMRRMYVGAILIAGILSFMPGRIMNHLVFG